MLVKSKRSTHALTLLFNKKNLSKSKRSQEEMVGFALIVILVAIILLVFLGISMRDRNEEKIESYEVDMFIQSFLQYTTDCSVGDSNYREIRELIRDCDKGELCEDGRRACEVLEETSEEILRESWENRVDTRGYILNISSREEEILNKEYGNKTNNYKAPLQQVSGDIEIVFKVYY